MKKAFSNKMVNHMKEATLLAKEYGAVHALYYVATKVTEGSLNEKLIKKRIKFIYNWVSDNYLQEFSSGLNYTDIRSKIASPGAFMGKCPIWIYWEQGIENAPELVRACFNSVIRNTRGGVYSYPFVFRKFRTVSLLA